MRLRLPRGRSLLVLTALFGAFLMPAAVAAAGAAGNGRVTPTVAAVSPSSSGARVGQAPDIFFAQLSNSADTFRKQAKAASLKYTERFAYKTLFKGVSVRIDRSDVGKLAGIASVQRVYPVHYYTLGPEPTADRSSRRPSR